MRAMRSVDLSFGMVNIPGQVFALQVDRQGTGLGNRCLKCKGPIGQRRYCKSCGLIFAAKDDPIAQSKDVMGYSDAERLKGTEEFGRLVLITEEELDAIKPPSSTLIAVQYFVPVKNLSRSLPLYAEKVYLWRAAAVKRGRTVLDNSHLRLAASLLRQVMQRVGVVGVAKVSLSRGREHVVLVWPEGRVLLLLQMRYETEVRLDYIEEAATQDEEGVEVAENLLAQGETVIKSMIENALGKELEADAYEVALNKLIDSKLKGEKLEIPAVAAREPTMDLQAALIASVKSSKRKIAAH